MKRRSPWLAFATCALLNGTLLAESSVRSVNPSAALVPSSSVPPALGISQAAGAAEAELARRGLAKQYTIASVSLIGEAAPNAYYLAKVQPAAGVDSLLKSLAFHVALDGQVTAQEEAALQ